MAAASTSPSGTVKDAASSGPFEKEDDTTDVTFIIEERKLHFNKTLLSIASPVFKRMFTGDFKERNATEIPLPGKHYEDMESFFKQIHPVHCFEAITDTNMMRILPLAHEYHVDSVVKKCEQHIGLQMSILWETISHDSLLLYLWMCEQYGLTTYREELIELGVNRRAKELVNSRFFRRVPSTAISELMTRRAVKLESKSQTPEGAKRPAVKLESKSQTPVGAKRKYNVF